MLPVEEVFDYNHVSRLLVFSALIYKLVALRRLAGVGKSKIPLGLLAIETDSMSKDEIINGVPHRLHAFEDDGNKLNGFSGPEMVFVIARSLANDGFNAPDEESVISEHKEVFSDACDSYSELLMAILEFLFKNGCLKKVEEPSPGGCQGHCGCICSKYGLHYIQCFFDQIHQEAETGSRNNIYKQVKGSLLGQQLGKRLSKPASAASVFRNWNTVLKNLVELESKGSISLSENVRTVWLNDRQEYNECVYAITVDRVLRKVIVVFRGSANKNDWQHNLYKTTIAEPNPIEEDYQGKDESIKILKGFHKLLLERRLDNGRRKYDEVADKVYEYGMELGEDFTVVVTGHSLGGALSALFGFFASFDERFTDGGRTVLVTTFAAPILGKPCFARAFLHQERSSKLACVRYVIDKDCIPRKLPWVDRKFAHTGYCVRLSTNGKRPKISYPHLKNVNKWRSPYNNIVHGALSKFLRTPQLLFRPTNIARYHGMPAYFFAVAHFVLQQKAKEAEIANAIKAKQTFETKTLERIHELRKQGFSDTQIGSWFPEAKPFMSVQKAADNLDVPVAPRTKRTSIRASAIDPWRLALAEAPKRKFADAQDATFSGEGQNIKSVVDTSFTSTFASSTEGEEKKEGDTKPFVSKKIEMHDATMSSAVPYSLGSSFKASPYIPTKNKLGHKGTDMKAMVSALDASFRDASFRD